MEDVRLIDLVLKELNETRHASVSVRRIFKKHKVKYTDELIRDIEKLLNSKSLVHDLDKDSRGYSCYALSVTGQDFIRTFGTYSNYLKGQETENRKVERAKNKKPYNAQKNLKGEIPNAYAPPEKTFMQRNGLALILFVFFIFLFFVVSRISAS